MSAVRAVVLWPSLLSLLPRQCPETHLDATSGWGAHWAQTSGWGSVNNALGWVAGRPRVLVSWEVGSSIRVQPELCIADPTQKKHLHARGSNL
ncbi:hypothetical protein T484DRAFT_2998968 [Baffinella frigidus]|nr:hypothetical protein T484DRAFT_2998968 [Cryptophyta sp. CCMP2293]